MKNKVKYLNGSVQAAFYGLRFRSNRLKHSVKRFDRFGLATLAQRLSNLFPNNVAVTLENSRKCRQNQLVSPKPQLWIYTPII